MSALRNVAAITGSAFRDFFWPRRCSGCGYRDVWLCDECLAKTPVWQAPWCSRCGIPVQFLCHCHELVSAISAARAVGHHTEWLQRGVQLFKYREELARADQFAPLMADAIVDLPVADLIVAVPLHRKREIERGYNQALLLAERISAEIGVPVADRGVFVRRANTRHQTGLSADERRKNLSNAFVVERPTVIAGSSVLLVDDVMTSGATMGACATIIRQAGAKHIQVVTVTRAINSWS